MYPLLPLWIVFVLYLPPPSQFQPTVRQIGADKGFLLQTWLLWKHHPLLGSEWSNFKKIFINMFDICQYKRYLYIIFYLHDEVILLLWPEFSSLALLCKLGLFMFKPHWEHQVKIWKEKKKGFWSSKMIPSCKWLLVLSRKVPINKFKPS